MSHGTPHKIRPHLALWLSLIALSGTGCTTLNLQALPFTRPESGDYKGVDSGFDARVSVSEQMYHAVRQARSENAVVLEVVGDDDRIRVMPLPPEQKAVRVSDLLTQTGVFSKLETVQATLYRHSSGSIGGVPMKIRMSSNCKRVRPESDYTLQAGDRLQVAKAPNPAFQNLFNYVLGK